MKQGWTCDGCEKTFDTKAEAQVCEEKHSPFIRVPTTRGDEDLRHTGGDVMIGVGGELIVFIPGTGDVLVSVESLVNEIQGKGKLVHRLRWE